MVFCCRHLENSLGTEGVVGVDVGPTVEGVHEVAVVIMEEEEDMGMLGGAVVVGEILIQTHPMIIKGFLVFLRICFQYIPNGKDMVDFFFRFSFFFFRFKRNKNS